jgi:microcystin-dependent protein
MTSSYTINSIGAEIKIGTFVGYASTNTPPTGWIVCDGVERNNTNNMYDALITMGIGSGNSEKYTPPDLTGRIMTGVLATSAGLSLNTTSGSDTISLTSANLPSHSHSITIENASHYHTYTDYYPTQTSGSNESVSNRTLDPGGYSSSYALGRTTGLGTDPAHTHTTTIGNVVGYNASGSINIKNASFHIVWILKYI